MEKEPKSFGRRKNGPAPISRKSRAKRAAPLNTTAIMASMPLSYVWFSFNMRINRKVYWLKGILLLFLAQIAFQLVAGASGFAVMSVFGPESIWLIIIAVILGVPFIGFIFWTSLAVVVKRCHDRDRSGWFLLIGFIPILGAIWLLVEIAFLKGTSGENRFGPDPLAVGPDPLAVGT
ncbi:MAG: DUF805 domain-containing protein [Alphaproteobacteria bacterium]|jgi:uncharacterized membrane protein YhaH (DUF805 family)